VVLKRQDSGIWREALRATSAGWDLALPIFAGVLAGYLLDQLVNTTYVFTLGFLVLGIATGYYNLIRSIRRLDERACRKVAGEKEGKQEGATQ
jgi:F0F1-type ATP synthase assembly protein I